MRWIVQEGLDRENGFAELREALSRGKVSYSFHKVLPFVGDLVPDIELDEPVMMIGAYSMRHVAKRKGWTPGVFDLEDYPYDVCVANWGDHMLNHGAVVCRFGDMLPHLETFGDRAFVRPSDDSKFFAGATMATGEIGDWWRKVKALDESGLCDPQNLNMDARIVLSRPRTILKEYRTWVIDKRVVTASLYRVGGNAQFDPMVDDCVLEYATERADEWSPVRAFVLDVAETVEGLKIVEINTLNSAGFYAANVGKLVEAMETMEPAVAFTVPGA